MNQETARLLGAFCNALRARPFLGSSPKVCQEYVDCESLRKLAKSHHTLSTHACNRTLTPREATRKSNIEKKAQSIVENYGLNIIVNGDARGWTLHLDIAETDLTWRGPRDLGGYAYIPY